MTGLLLGCFQGSEKNIIYSAHVPPTGTKKSKKLF
jgi:hypothetical protein